MDLLKQYQFPCDPCGSGTNAAHFCNTCAKNLCNICSEQHRDHNMNSFESGVHMTLASDKTSALPIEDKSNSKDANRQKTEVLVDLVSKIDDRGLLKTLDSKQGEIIKKGYDLKQKLEEQYKEFKVILDKRLQEHEKEIAEKTAKQIEVVSKTKIEIEEGMKKANDLLKSTRQDNVLQEYEELVKMLTTHLENFNGHDDVSIHYTQACTVEGFQTLVRGLGTVTEHRSGSDENPVDDPPIQFDCTSLQKALQSLVSERSVPLSIPKSTSDIRDEPHGVLSSTKLGTKTSEHKCTYESTGFQSHVGNKATPGIPENKDNFTKQVEVNDLPMAKLCALNSDSVRLVLKRRLSEWNLEADWRVNGRELVVKSSSLLSAKRCLNILTKSLHCEPVFLRKEYIKAMNSTKWKTFLERIKTQSPDHVWIPDPENNTLYVCSLTSSVSPSVSDRIKTYLRDNQILDINVRFTEEIVQKLRKHKNRLKKLQTSSSSTNYNVSISFNDKENDVVRVEGTGFGVASTVRELYYIASRAKHPNDDDEERFSSEDEEEERFSEDEKGEGKEANVVQNVKIQAMQFVSGENTIDINAVCFCGNDRIIYVVTGDITILPVEAILNPANQKLKHDGGLAKVLCKKGGQSIQLQCTSYVDSLPNKALSPGDIYSSKAGTLNLRQIIHVVVSRYDKDANGAISVIGQTVTDALVSAAEDMIEIVAIPALGAGSFKVPADLSADKIVETIKQFWLDNPESGIREIYLCDMNSSATSEFVKAAKKHFPEEDSCLVCEDVVNKGSVLYTRTQEVRGSAEHRRSDGSQCNFLFL